MNKVERVTIALDVMGADSPPRVICEGAVEAAKRAQGAIGVTAVGLEEEVAWLRNAADEIHVHAAETYVAMTGNISSIRRDGPHSVSVAAQLASTKQVDGFISFGHSGATYVAALAEMGRISGVRRPAIAVRMPGRNGDLVLIDGGANAVCKPEWLYQFGQMGRAYSQSLGVEDPRVCLLSIGEEEGKGNELVRAAHELMKESLGYRGLVEGNTVFGEADVVVTDGFTGNVFLKGCEGMGKMMGDDLRLALGNPWLKPFLLMVRRALTRFRNRYDWRQYGAMPVVGVKGVCGIGHGRSDRLAVASGIDQLASCIRAKLVDKIATAVASPIPRQ